MKFANVFQIAILLSLAACAPAPDVATPAPSPPAASTESAAAVEPEPVEEIPYPMTRHHIGFPAHRYPLQLELPLAPEADNTWFDYEIRDNKLILRRLLQPDEAIWGFGQRFDAFNLRGRSLESWVTDNWNNLDTSYFAVPFFISSAGYGMFINHSGRITFDLGATNPDELVITIPDAGVEWIQFTGAPADISLDYTQLVGRPRPAPGWVFRPWMSRNSYLGAYEVTRMLRRMHELDMPVGVVVLEAWAEELHNFQFNSRRFPNPITWIRDLNQRGVEVVAWITSSYWTNSKAYTQSLEHDFLVRNEDGSEHIVRWLENGRKVDFRNPAARTWWRDLQAPLIATGVSGIKTDGGEHHPDPLFHNRHPYHYQQASLDAFDAAGRDGVTFARSANPLNAGSSLFWAGDQDAQWSRLAGVVRGGLSAALSGFPYWGHDIGGYTGTPDKELYIRWLQFGAFSPIMHFHGITPREPWHYDRETIDIARFYFGVRKKLQPYLLVLRDQAVADGFPLMRPLIWDFFDDPETHDIGSQYLLGPDLLIAPIVTLNPTRSVYIPDGTWIDAWAGQAHNGPTRITVETALHQIPVLIRESAAADFAGLFDDAPARETPPVSIRLIGETNERGIVPHVRYWQPGSAPEVFAYRVTNNQTEPVGFTIRCAPVPNLMVNPDQIIRFVLQPGESRDVTFQAMPDAYEYPGSYPLMLEARANAEDMPAPVAGIAVSPRWFALGLFEGGVDSPQDIEGESIDLNAEYTGAHGETQRWIKLPPDVTQLGGLIDLGPILGHAPYHTSYLHAVIPSSRARRAWLHVGSGDAMTIWLNGRQIFHVAAHRNPERDENTIETVLLSGENHLTIRIHRDIAPHHVYFRLD